MVSLDLRHARSLPQRRSAVVSPSIRIIYGVRQLMHR